MPKVREVRVEIKVLLYPDEPHTKEKVAWIISREISDCFSAFILKVLGEKEVDV